MSRVGRPNFDRFLCDTWWYGATQRIDDETFEELTKLRAQQGFTAVQMVVGIPPEIGPENPNASSKVGPAWDLRGEFNQDYLKHARERVESLNSHGLAVIAYGAWGHQIEWLGETGMKDWWREIVKHLDDLEVMYCITGESDIWVGQENKLLPDKTTAELGTVRLRPFLHPKLVRLGRRLANSINESLNERKKTARRRKWTNVLSEVSSITDRPIFMHVCPNRTSQEVVSNPGLLDAITVQTGHDMSTRRLLWELALRITRDNPEDRFINLEPWYEGITGRFGSEDQLYAYWASMMAGAYAFCYGAHGIWNAGDGKFLAHWGKQTMDEAMKLETPRLLGRSHELLVESGFAEYPRVEVEEARGELTKITRSDDEGRFVSYVPDVRQVPNAPEGNVFLPSRGEFARSLPKEGPVVVISG